MHDECEYDENAVRKIQFPCATIKRHKTQFQPIPLRIVRGSRKMLKGLLKMTKMCWSPKQFCKSGI